MKTLNVRQHLCLSMLLRLSKIGVHGLMESLSGTLPKSSPERIAVAKVEKLLRDVKYSLESKLYMGYRDRFGDATGLIYRDMLDPKELTRIELLEKEVADAIDE